MKTNTYSVYSSEFRDSIKDSIISKPTFLKHLIHEKPSPGTGFTSARTTKNQIHLPQNLYADSNKITNLVSPLNSPKVESQQASHRTLIPTPKAQYSTNTENILKLIAQKKSTSSVNTTGTANKSSLNNSSSNHPMSSSGYHDSKKQKQAVGGSSKENLNTQHSISRNSSLKKSITVSNPLMSASSTPSTYHQARSYGLGESSNTKVANSNNENSLNLDGNNFEYSPLQNSKNESLNSKFMTNSQLFQAKEDDKLQKKQMASPARKLDFDSRAESHKNLQSKIKTDNYLSKMITNAIKNSITPQFDNSNDYNIKDVITTNTSAAANDSLTGKHSKHSLQGERQSHNFRERTLSSATNYTHQSVSRDKLNPYTKENSLDRITKDRDYLKDFENFDEPVQPTREKLEKNLTSKELLKFKNSHNDLQKAKSSGNINDDDLFFGKEREKRKHNTVSSSNSLNMYKNLSSFALYTLPRELKQISKAEKVSLHKSPNTISLDLDVQSSSGIYTKGLLSGKEKNSPYVGSSGKHDPKGDKVVSKTLGDEEPPIKISSELELVLEKYSKQERPSLEEEPQKLRPYSGGMNRGTDKKYAETTKNKDGKKFELPVKYVGDYKRGHERELVNTHNSGMVSTSTSSLSIKELKAALNGASGGVAREMTRDSERYVLKRDSQNSSTNVRRDADNDNSNTITNYNNPGLAGNNAWRRESDIHNKARKEGDDAKTKKSADEQNKITKDGEALKMKRDSDTHPKKNGGGLEGYHMKRDSDGSIGRKDQEYLALSASHVINSNINSSANITVTNHLNMSKRDQDQSNLVQSGLFKRDIDERMEATKASESKRTELFKSQELGSDVLNHRDLGKLNSPVKAFEDKVPMSGGKHFISEDKQLNYDKRMSKMGEYGNNQMGIELKKMYESMRALLEVYRTKEETWIEEKILLISRIAALEKKVSAFENGTY